MPHPVTFDLALRATLAVLLTSPLLVHAELFPEGLAGAKLGQSRIEAITALINSGVAPDLEKSLCSESVPEKNKFIANRVCKLAIQPGSSYQGLPINKVSFLLQDDTVVLIGMDVGATTEAFSALRSDYALRWGKGTKYIQNTSAVWNEPEVPGGNRGTYVRLFADTQNSLVVYAYRDVL